MNDPILLSTKEAVKYLKDRGISHSESWLQDHAKKGEIEFLRNPKEHFRFAPAFLDAYIDSQTDSMTNSDIGVSEPITPLDNANEDTKALKQATTISSLDRRDSEESSSEVEEKNIPTASDSSGITSDYVKPDTDQLDIDSDKNGYVNELDSDETQNSSTKLTTATLTFRQLLILLGMIVVLVALIVYFRENFKDLGAFVSIVIFAALSLMTAMLVTAVRNEEFQLTKKDLGIRGVGGFFIASMAVLYIGYERVSGFDERIEFLESAHKKELERVTNELNGLHETNSKLSMDSNELSIHRAWLETSRLDAANNKPMSLKVVVQCGPNQDEPPEFYYTLRQDSSKEDSQLFASNEQTFNLGEGSGTLTLHTHKKRGASNVMTLNFDGKLRFNPSVTITPGSRSLCKETENSDMTLVQLTNLVQESANVVNESIEIIASGIDDLTSESAVVITTAVANKAILHLGEDNNPWIDVLGLLDTPWKTSDPDYRRKLLSSLKETPNDVGLKNAVLNMANSYNDCRTMVLLDAQSAKDRAACLTAFANSVPNFLESFEARVLAIGALLEGGVLGQEAGSLELLTRISREGLAISNLLDETLALPEEERVNDDRYDTDLRGLQTVLRAIMSIASYLAGDIDQARVALSTFKLGMDPPIDTEMFAVSDHTFSRRLISVPEFVEHISNRISAEPDPSHPRIPPLTEWSEFQDLSKKLSTIKNTGYLVAVNSRYGAALTADDIGTIVADIESSHSESVVKTNPKLRANQVRWVGAAKNSAASGTIMFGPSHLEDGEAMTLSESCQVVDFFTSIGYDVKEHSAYDSHCA